MAVLGVEENKRGNFARRQRFERLRTQLENERQSFEAQWRDNSNYILPTRSRFQLTDANRGNRKNQNIIDSTATMSARTLRSGMMSGITSPARPWFKLDAPDLETAESGPVKSWLHTTTERMRTVFLKSNLYNTLPVLYGDIGVFGTGALLVEEDIDTLIRFSVQPIGSYSIAQDDKGIVNTFVREFRMTVAQVVSKFGRDPEDPKKINWDNISSKVQNLWETNNTEARIDIVHIVEPNDKFDPEKLEAKYKRFLSVYYEQGTTGKNSQGNYLGGTEHDKFLSESGFDFFPVLAPRWEVTGEDIYGTDCPGMVAIGDIKQLQIAEKRGLQAIEKMINPPMIAPTSLRTAKASILPGDITYTDDRDGRAGFRPAHEINFNLPALEQKQAQVRNRIQRAFFEDLFLMLAQSDRRQITAREIEERHEEKLLALGPVLEQLNQDLLDPLIDITFSIMLKRGEVPEAPPELEGVDLKVEYISIMAQAQKLAGLGGIERFAGFAGQIASVDPGILDKIDADQMIDFYGDLTSIPPGIVRSDAEVEQLRAERQQAQAQAQKAQEAALQAQTAKTLSETDVEGENGLTAIAGGIVG
jgi:hypothetical protein